MLWLYVKLCHLRDRMGSAGAKGNLIMIIIAALAWLVILVCQIVKFIN